MLPLIEEHRNLARLEGRWEGTGEVLPNPWGPSGPTQGEWQFRRDLAGYNLIHDYQERRSGGHVFQGHGVMTVDPATEETLWFWFDSVGYPPLAPSRGKWSGQELQLRKATPRGVGVSTFTVKDDVLTYVVQAQVKGENELSLVMRGVFRRSVAA